MPTCEASAFLRSAAPRLREAVAEMSRSYDYASVLGTDSFGVNYSVTPDERRAGDSPWLERGFVFRVQRNGVIAEYALNELPAGNLARAVAPALDKLLESAAGARRYPAIPDEAARGAFYGECSLDPFAPGAAELVLGRLEAARAAISSFSDEIAFSAGQASFMRVSKLFLSPARDLEQAFVWGQAYLTALARRGSVSKEDYLATSGRRGLELLDGLEDRAPGVAAEAVELLGASKMEPGEYDVVLDPDMAGTLAHEAFGHGVEMDMFVKGRAKAPEYLGKPIASPLVTMYDGAAGADQCGSFYFDDEGRLGGKTRIIDKGTLVAGISDLSSALFLGTEPTGNGRRQAYDHKAYARMTNTYFEPGASTRDEMLASIRHGWLLQRLNSGMEDPKNWGIQLIALVGREIVDGKLSGRVASPVVCSGYVPKVLSDISMLSRDFELHGSGYCGKGYKELVKVSCGGPYVKTRMRLG